jgi:hypothetical protein
MPRDPMKPVLTVQHQAFTNELFVIHPGETFNINGNSNHKYECTLNAALVFRTTIGEAVNDTLYDIENESVWRWIASLINVKVDDFRALVNGDQP